jgi:YidC/Oxa1 family membrane protein insertase
VDLLNGLMKPLYLAVSWILVTFHTYVFGPLFGATSGMGWGMSIVGLVVVIRILLIPLFVRQIKAQRGMQLLQPQMKEIQKKYKDDRAKQQEELMKLYRETGTNPFASCLPIILQMPIFFALFHVINVGIKGGQAVGAMTTAEAQNASEARIFGAPLAATFMDPAGGNQTTVRIVCVLLIVAMSATTFITQRQLMVKNMPSGQDNPMAQQMKILLYAYPFMFAIFGINFPVGVLLYWLTTNLWTMGQQFYVIRRNPAPGSQAWEAKQQREAARARQVPADQGRATGAVALETADPEPPKGQRQQPKRKPRSQRRTGAAGSSPGSGPADGPPAGAAPDGEDRPGGTANGGKE